MGKKKSTNVKYNRQIKEKEEKEELEKKWNNAQIVLNEITVETKAITDPQYFSLNTFFTEPLYTDTLCPGEQALFKFWQKQIWLKKDVLLTCSSTFLAANTGISESSVKRHVRRLTELSLCRCVQPDHEVGNQFVVEPLLLPQFYWTKLPIKNLPKSLYHKFVGQLVQNGPTEILSQISELVQNEPTDSSKWTIIRQLARTRSVQNGPQIYLLYSLLSSDAARRTSKNKSAGDKNASERCPSDRSDRGKGRGEIKGVRLPADHIEKPLIGVAGLTAEIEKIRREKEKEKRKSF